MRSGNGYRRFHAFAALLLSSILSAPLAALEVRYQATPGGVVVLDLGPASGTAPQATLADKPVLVIAKNGRWQAIVGISLTTEPGWHRIQLTDEAREVGFHINGKAYPEQRLVIKNRRKVNPAEEDLLRIRHETARSVAARNTYSDELQTNRLVLPVEGRRSSAYGLRRFFNNQPRRPHAGLDIAASTGTEIRAPADGRVIESGDFFFNGNCVFLDHGKGLITFYAHMNDIAVRQGQQVKQGEVIGTVGATGRVTGPHLHWSVGLNGTWVDPTLFIDNLP